METGSPPPEPREDRGPRIPPAKLATIKAEPTISIFYKPTKSAALQLLDGKFPQDAAMVFCDRIRRELLDNSGTKSFTVTGNDVTGLNEVLAWIKQCVSEGSIIKYKDLSDDTPNLLTAYANVIVSATYLGIPARDLAEGLTKRMQAIARRVLMSWDEVEWFYNSPALRACGDSVREVAAASIFWAWWNRKLDDEETPDDMMFLDVLRQEISKLNDDLHNWCDRNEQAIRAKWEEKKNGRAAETAGADSFQNDGLTSRGVGGGWDDTAASPTGAGAGSGGWDDENSPPAAKASNDADGDELAVQETSNTGDAAGQASRDGEANPDRSSGVDSAIDVGTGSGSPASAVDKSTGYDLPEQKDHAAGPGEHQDTASYGVVGDDLGADGGDWADEVNQHDTTTLQGW
ncbi:hypothetical protein A1O1_04715 [Capronia coronata CBS 617.96]|uniref:Uncharacterized protein n=1 Tax=Capronia coronata CBS 617.96 TaxID=1182541 RepID=W9Y5I3_9EURO|nr:uncharacterized protein A1O1_04715 [Capronia coronata CBS 617.96]EXJ87788.1 hypothetical protein A1O1_04715 [Capronia coronata CBS 617.96]